MLAHGSLRGLRVAALDRAHEVLVLGQQRRRDDRRLQALRSSGASTSTTQAMNAPDRRLPAAAVMVR